MLKSIDYYVSADFFLSSSSVQALCLDYLFRIA